MVMVTLLLAVGGCAAPAAPTVWTIDAAGYGATFDAAVDALRDAGYVTAVRDRSGGVVESEPLRIGGVLEPWLAVRQPWSLTGESSLALQRRRARVEFDVAADTTPESRAELPGAEAPDVIGAAAPDLRTVIEPLRVRVWVAVERAHTPGNRRFAWSYSRTTRYSDPRDPIDPADGVVASSIWTPIGRDEDAERRLAQRIRTAVERNTPERAATDGERIADSGRVSDPR